MIGMVMDAGGAPGELALHSLAARVLRGPKRAGRRTISLARTLFKRLGKSMAAAGDWEALTRV